jgi:acyl-coenzyme A thioesterase PaaI-like protein
MPNLSKILTKAPVLKAAMNVWPPFLFAGIQVKTVSSDFREIQVCLYDRVFNRNYVGTHFGGSMFAMLDPFFMLMVMRNLGSRYYVWDRSGSIDFLAPGRGKLTARLTLSDHELARIRDATADGAKHEPVFDARIEDERGEAVAVVHKTLYVRLKPAYREGRRG